GKLIYNFPVLSALGRQFCSMPPFNRVPPQQPQPFVHASLGPLPVGPPTCPELRLVASRSNREGLPLNLVAEDAERAACVELRCDNQDPAAFFPGQAFFHVVRFLPSRKPLNGTDPDRCRLRKSLYVLLRQLHLSQPVNLG